MLAGVAPTATVASGAWPSASQVALSVVARSLVLAAAAVAVGCQGWEVAGQVVGVAVGQAARRAVGQAARREVALVVPVAPVAAAVVVVVVVAPAALVVVGRVARRVVHPMAALVVPGRRRRRASSCKSGAPAPEC